MDAQSLKEMHAPLEARYLDTDAGEEEVASLLKLTERYCVVYQSLARPPAFTISSARSTAGG